MRAAAALVVLAFAFAALPMGAAVVVELFTSQGCSSCPPADQLLAELQKNPDVIAIAYHVDYWDSLGWRDPFSSRQWTERQLAYVRAMRLPSAYTPQMVVGGTRQMVGSSGAVVRSAIEAAASERAVASVSIALARDTAVITTVSARSGLDLVVVALDDPPPTRVRAGENDGRLMRNDAVARHLVRLGGIGAGEQLHRVKISGRRVVAMLQEPTAQRIYAAASAQR